MVDDGRDHRQPASGWHVYFDAPRLRSANGLVQLLGNQRMLLTSRLTVLRRQRTLIDERWEGAFPEDIQQLRADELAFLDELAVAGRALSSEARERFSALQQSIAFAITDRENSPGSRLLANINLSYTWVKLAQRGPVRIRIDPEYPGKGRLRAGTTATVTVLEQQEQQ